MASEVEQRIAGARIDLLRGHTQPVRVSCAVPTHSLA